MSIVRYFSGNDLSILTQTQLVRGEAIVRQLDQPAEDAVRSQIFWGDNKEARIRAQIERAQRAYIVDGLLRQGVDKHAELCRGVTFSGGDLQVKYVNKRLDAMSLATGQHWRLTFSTCFLEYWKTGNPMFVKMRGGTAKRHLYKEAPYPIAGFYPLGIERLETVHDKDNRFIGWSNKEGKANPSRKSLRIRGAIPLDNGQPLVSISTRGVADEVLIPGMDIVHIPYRKAPDSNYGLGLTIPALEDVALLRAIEQITATVIKKNSHPVYHHGISGPSSPLSSIQSEIDYAGALWRKAGPDGVLITGPNHDIKAIGAESQALRLEGYLIHFTKRALASLGVNPYLMGFESATIGTAEGIMDLLIDRVRAAHEEIAWTLQMFLIWEILYEGGFDPWSKEEDRVYVQFAEIDAHLRIKEESHAADLYTKNVIDVDETRARIRLAKGYTPSRLYLHQVQIPLARVAADAQVQSAKISASKTTPAKVSAMVDGLKVELADNVDLFIECMVRNHNVPLEALLVLQPSLQAFSMEPEAVKVLLTQVLCEK